jgi:hypothetical protein
LGIQPSLLALDVAAEAAPSEATSATRYDLSESILVVPVVVPEREFVIEP